MSHYVKLWSQILESTIWQEPNDMLVLWIAILALKDQHHVVRGTIPGLAARAKITNEECAEYIARFEGPDKWSGNQEFEGRRLERVEGGWLVLNGNKYQQLMREEYRRESVRQAVAKCREKKKGKPASHEPQSAAGRRLNHDGKGTAHIVTPKPPPNGEAF